MRSSSFLNKIGTCVLLMGCLTLSTAHAAEADDERLQQTLAQVRALQGATPPQPGAPSTASVVPPPPGSVTGALSPAAGGRATFVDGTPIPPSEVGAMPQNFKPPQNTPAAMAMAANAQAAAGASGAGAPAETPFGFAADPAAAATGVPRQEMQMAANKKMPAPDPSEAAFANAAGNLLPLSTEQIRRLRQMFNATQAATAAPAGVPPRPKASSQFVNLAPGATPPVVRLAQGFVTSVVFLDSTGAPWPLEAYDIGDPAAFNIVWNKKDNMLMIQSMTLYNYGNLAVRLQGLNTPVMITLIPGQSAVDYRIDMRVQGLGPNAKPLSNNDGLPQSESTSELLSVLDGCRPRGHVHSRLQEGRRKSGW